MPPGGGLYRDLLADRRFGIVLLVTAAGTIGNLFPPALPAIAAGLGIGEGTVGLIVTAYKLPSVLIIPVAAAIADLYGRRIVLIPSLLLYGSAGLALFFLSSFGALLTVTLIVGIGAAAVYPLSVTLLGDFFDAQRNATGQGIRVGLIGLAAILIPAVTGFVAGFRWNFPFLLFGLILPIVAIVAIGLHEPVRSTSATGSIREALVEYGTSIGTELRDPGLAVLVFGGFVRGFTRYALLTFAPVFAVSVLGASLFDAGLVLSARGLVYVIVAPFAGQLVAHFPRKHLHIGALGISGSALVGLPLVQDVTLLAAVVALHTIGDALFDPINKGTVTTTAQRQYRAGVVNALYVCKRVGQAAAPVAFGLLLTATGYSIMFATAAAVIGGYLVAFTVLFAYRPVS